jgi:ATP-binding cassette subfamily B protein
MKSLGHLNKYFWKYRWYLIGGILTIACTNFLDAFKTNYLGREIDRIIKYSDGNSHADLIKIGLIFIGIYFGMTIGKAVFQFLNRQFIIVMSRKIEYDLKNEIFDKYQQLSMSFYKRNSTGDLMNRISEDVTKVRSYLGPGIMYSINVFFLFGFVLYFMLSISPKLTLYALTPLPVMSVIIYFVSSTMNKLSEKVQRQQSDISTFAQESFSGIRVIKAHYKQDEFIGDFEKESQGYFDKSMRLAKVNSIFMPTIIGLVGLSTIITIYIGGTMVNAGTLTYGQIVQFVIYINMLTWPVTSIGWVTSLIQRAAASQTRINEFLSVEPEITNPNLENYTVRGEIEFRNVHFKYPDTGVHALKGISFKVNPGETLAILGRTGSGKSTIAQLVGRIYDSTDGKIYVDQKNIEEHNLDILRSSIGYVPQENFLFSDTIANNIQFGSDEELAIEEIEWAAKRAQVYGNIIDFSKGFDTLLGERGVTLSGGQKQRVSIARAVIKKPPILVFDDCLSAVDNETEQKILNELKDLMAEKTTIIISHRISSISHANRILFLEDGHIIEHGTHEELMAKKGAYHQLYLKQVEED